MSALAIHWARPDAIWLLVGWLVVVALALLLERRGRGALDRLVSSALQSSLVVRPARWRRRARLGLLAIAGLAMALALLQPQMGERFVATPRVGAEIMIALDVSRSMLADDAAPSRLERAKAEIRDLLAYLRDDHVGLIAFAGRASVLSPMTPDKSFLRLALDGAGPHSVPRGGTKLAEAIRRAVTGFGPPGPAQRALILITDGEDHDSFALDAARAAAEAGIKIIAIGFGDEAGSPIFVRDPDTGARVQVRDADGQPVMSRLDGDLLRELALATDGAYVPAGTGVLDLASIYDAHIAGLTRGQIDERGRTIRDEAYQLFVAVAFVALLAAVFLVGGRSGRTAGASEGSRASNDSNTVAGRSAAASVGLALLPVAIACAVAIGASDVAHAQDQDVAHGQGEDVVHAQDEDAASARSGRDASAAAASPGPAGAAADGFEAARPASEASELDPRARFNRANEALAAGDAISAAAGFRAARRDAPDDPTLRYAATFNLGMAAVARAEQAETPEARLSSLHEAADWFREAAALRPDEADPRHNLAVALRRALLLADEIARREDGDIETTLDALIERQRGQVARTAELLGATAGATGPDAAIVIDRMRPAFDAAATDQRVLRTDADELAERVVREREAILRMAQDVRSPADTLRAAQLEGVLVYLDSAIERMGATRRQLRLRRPERAYRRGAAALGELKRARDQLRDPVEQIGLLLGETGELVRKTGALLATERPAGGGQAAARLPAFLTPTALEEDARRLTERVSELAARLTHAAEEASRAEAGAAPPPAGAPSAAQPGAPDPARLRAALAAAAPRVGEAATSLEAATTSLAAEQLSDALSSEAAAGRALADAQEQFFDLSRLLVVTHEDQARIADLALSDDAETAEARDEYAPLAAEMQARNLSRAARLETLLADERAKALAAAEQAAAQAPSADEASDPRAAEKARFDAADGLLAAAIGEMEAARFGFESTRVEWASSGAHAARARDHLETLRSLFYSLVEHLQALARDQVDLSDETNDVAALAASEAAPDAARGPETRARAAALVDPQAGLETRAGALADVLLEQSQAAPPADAASGQAPSPAGDEAAAAAEAQETLRRAAEHVASAQLAMREAGQGLEDETAAFEPVQSAQTLAAEELARAIQLLQPPPPPEDSQGGEEQQQEQQPSEGGEQEQPQDGEAGADGEPEAQQGAGDADEGSRENPPAEGEEALQDPGQLLQGVRDREAERRRDRERARREQRSRPVDRDW